MSEWYGLPVKFMWALKHTRCLIDKAESGGGASGQPLFDAEPGWFGHWSSASGTPSPSPSGGGGGGGDGDGGPEQLILQTRASHSEMPHGVARTSPWIRT